MPCGWEGNRRSGVAVAMRSILQSFIHLRADGRYRTQPMQSSHGVYIGVLCLYNLR